MKDENHQDLSKLVQRGKEIQRKVEQLKSTEGLAAFIDFFGKLATSQLDPNDRDFSHNVRTASIQLLSGPLLTLKQDYQEWYMDCRTFFAEIGWISNKTVSAFLEAGSVPIGKKTNVTVEMVIKRQMVFLEQILDSPPKQWNKAKAAFIIAYIAFCLFLDIVLFAYVGLATIPVAAFQVGLIVAFPKIEEWIRNF